MSDEADRYTAAVDSLDPAVCDTHGHDYVTLIECSRCGATFHPTDTEGTHG